MSVRAESLSMSFAGSVLLVALVVAGGGCCPRCGSRCIPRGPWQSPTIQATRALLVVNTKELHILRIDGKNVQPACVGADGVCEYYVPGGTHTITASFRYAAPVSGGLIGAVHGAPLTVRHQFITGHEYVPIYREHQGQEPETEYLLDAIASVVSAPDRYWSLEIADLAQARPDPEPEVEEARLYCRLIRAPHPTMN